MLVIIVAGSRSFNDMSRCSVTFSWYRICEEIKTMKEIRILLENCDVITVDSKDVKFLDMEQINKLPQDINIVC